MRLRLQLLLQGALSVLLSFGFSHTPALHAQANIGTGDGENTVSVDFYRVPRESRMTGWRCTKILFLHHAVPESAWTGDQRDRLHASGA